MSEKVRRGIQWRAKNRNPRPALRRASSAPGAKETAAACVRQRKHPRPPILRSSRKKCDDDDDDGGANTTAAGRDEQWVNLVHGVRILSDAHNLSRPAIGRTQPLDRPGRGWRIAVYQRAADSGGQPFEMVDIALLRGNHHVAWHVADG